MSWERFRNADQPNESQTQSQGFTPTTADWQGFNASREGSWNSANRSLVADNLIPNIEIGDSSASAGSPSGAVPPPWAGAGGSGGGSWENDPHSSAEGHGWHHHHHDHESQFAGGESSSQGGNVGNDLLVDKLLADPTMLQSMQSLQGQMTPEGFSALEQSLTQNLSANPYTSDSGLMQQAYQQLSGMGASSQDLAALQNSLAGLNESGTTALTGGDGSGTTGSASGSDPIIQQFAQSDPELAQILTDSQSQMSPQGYSQFEQMVAQNWASGQFPDDNSLLQQSLSQFQQQGGSAADTTAAANVISSDTQTYGDSAVSTYQVSGSTTSTGGDVSTATIPTSATGGDGPGTTSATGGDGTSTIPTSATGGDGTGTIPTSATGGDGTGTITTPATGSDGTGAITSPATGGDGTSTTSTSNPSGLNHALGFYDSTAGDPTGDEQLAQTLNGPVQMSDYFPTNSSNGNIATDSTWLINDVAQWKQQNPNSTPILAVPLVQSTGGDSLANAAAGGDNSNFQQLAQQMVSAGLGDSVIRLGWEANGNWYAWSADANPQQYIQAFQNAVTAMRSVPGANFTFDWDVNAGQSGLPAGDTLASFYPGNNYVNDIGIDAYDNQPWNTILNGTMGLNAVQQFAAANGKTMSVDEWGLWPTNQGGQGTDANGDDPTYINNMANFFNNTPNLAFESFFNGGTGSLQSLANNPASQAAYDQDFQGQ